jgi:hypothetical protein
MCQALLSPDDTMVNKLDGAFTYLFILLGIGTQGLAHAK